MKYLKHFINCSKYHLTHNGDSKAPRMSGALGKNGRSDPEKVLLGAVLHDFHDAVTVHLQMLFALERLLDGDLDDAALLRGDDAVAAALDEALTA